MKGKNFSCNNASGKRRKSDFYQTPYSMTEQLLKHEYFDYSNTVLEPACGEGAITRILQNNFSVVTHSDISINEKTDLGTRAVGLDFLEDEYGWFDYIITNPPFSLAFEFIQKAKEVAREKFAMLLPLSYLHGQKRYEDKIFRDSAYPLTKVHIFTRYPMLCDTIRKDGKYTTGMMVYCWMIFEKDGYNYGLNNIPQIKWINNQKYILSAKELLSGV